MFVCQNQIPRQERISHWGGGGGDVGVGESHEQMNKAMNGLRTNQTNKQTNVCQ